ncbi:TRAP transporter large permease [Aureibaculum algae]|uniref:TRAP transporter large permease n=1 Tax=Aureibaculum algae TaxID=2584122 RepID=A0A5B7TYH8_9FLAO|nr:TRAP transporter large permease [Aureibaculum algae]QCX40361.1 TRAP transporter large permease [Aureibaculum algae]
MIVVLILLFVFFLVIRVPIAFALGMACLIYCLITGIDLIIIPMKMYSGIDVFVLLSVPGFIFAGNLMNQGGITERIISFCNHLLGHIRGGLSLANIGASMLFAGISGTAVSDTASIGSVMIPAMKKEGYSPEFACAVTAASSTVGPIIPPSVPLIIVATLGGVSVGKLFLAGAIPGFLLGFGLMMVAYIISVKRKYPKHPRSSLKNILKSFINTFWALLMTFVILFGIIGGIFTPTEASIIAVVYAIIIGIFVYKKLNFKRILVVLLDSMKTSASLMVLIGFANLFGWLLVTEQFPQMISDQLLSFSENKYVLLLLINIVLIFVGTFMETLAALLILFPILLKVALMVDVDPIHFSVIAVLNLIIGLTTPPVGMCLFISASIGKISIVKVSKEILPFVFVSLVVLTLVTLIPDISLFLPRIFAE